MSRIALPRLDNPILTKELRTRMRGGRAAVLLLSYVGILALILFFSYLGWWRGTQQDGGDGLSDLGGAGGAAFNVGRTFYYVLFVIQALLVGLVTPALTAGGVTIEREQRTYELLSVSLLPRRSLVLGKLFAAVAFVALLVMASLPLASLCFLLGGVSPGEVAAAAGLLILSAFVYGATGIAWSAIARTTTLATLLAYATNLGLFLATAFFALPNLWGAVTGFGGAGMVGVGLQALNPMGAVFYGTVMERYFGVALPAWLPALAINGLFGAIVSLVALHRLEPPRTDRAGILRLLTAALVLLVALCAYGFLLPRVPGLRATLPTFQLILACVVTVYTPCLLAPIFATADELPRPGGVWSLLDPRRLGRGEAPSGVLYTVLLIALCCGSVLLWGGPAGKTAELARLLAMTVAFAFGLGGLGVFSTAAFRGQGRRWRALFVTFLIGNILLFQPILAVTSRWQESGWRPSAFENLLYVSPLTAAVSVGDPNAFSASQPLHLWFGTHAYALVTGALYLVLGAVFLGLAAAVDARRQRGDAASEKSRPDPTRE